MAQVTTAMAKKKPEQACTYTSTKIDDEVLPLVKAAASLARKDVQDYISDVLNAHASLELSREPIKRRPRRPRERKPKP